MVTEVREEGRCGPGATAAGESDVAAAGKLGDENRQTRKRHDLLTRPPGWRAGNRLEPAGTGRFRFQSVGARLRWFGEAD
jgi:hypothetical protein